MYTKVIDDPGAAVQKKYFNCNCATMSSAECLRDFVNERLSAAAEEIFRVFKTAVVEYEEEINRQRKLLDVVWKPTIQLHRIGELPQQHALKEEEAPADLQLCDQERSSSQDQEEPELPKIKETQEQLCTRQKGEQLVVKHETDAFMLTPTHKESEHSKAASDQKLLSNSCVAESQSQQLGAEHEASRSMTNAEPESQSESHSDDANNFTFSEIHSSTGEKFRCDTCGKAFKCRSHVVVHLRNHTGEKPFLCKTCGKRFKVFSSLEKHIRIHTGERPYTCNTCGKKFRQLSELRSHTRIHTGEKPYACITCGKTFRQLSQLSCHKRTHTGERPFSCKTCGKAYAHSYTLTQHKRTHSNEKLNLCTTCGQRFKLLRLLKQHMKIHIGEKPLSCTTCGKKFNQISRLNNHIKLHIDGKPYSCKTCGKVFSHLGYLSVHMRRAHADENCNLHDLQEEIYRYQYV